MPAPPPNPPPPPQWRYAAPPQHPPPRPPTPHRAPKKSNATVWVVVGVALALLVGAVVIGFPLWRMGSGSVLDVSAAQAGVRQILSDPINGYGANDVTAVTCNGGENPAVVPGEGFTCEVLIDDVVRRVEVVFVDDAGTYEVDGPR